MITILIILLVISPFIREIDSNLYHSVDNNFVEIKTGTVSTDVNNYLRLSGYSNIQKLYQELEYKEKLILVLILI